MKYKPGDIINFKEKNLSKIVLASWQILQSKEVIENFYYCIIMNNKFSYSVEDISKFIKTFGTWISEDKVHLLETSLK